MSVTKVAGHLSHQAPLLLASQLWRSLRRWPAPADALPRAPSREAHAGWALVAGWALLAATTTLYVKTRSPSLDDWDSVDFARAMRHFDVRLQQPQPPGYPAYVFLARLVNVFAHDPLTSLTLLSATCGALCVLAFYVLARDLGLGWVALPLAVMPLFWLDSEMALTDVPGLLFAVAAVWLLHRVTITTGSSRFCYLLAGTVMAGVGAGVRPQDLMAPLSVFAL